MIPEALSAAAVVAAGSAIVYYLQLRNAYKKRLPVPGIEPSFPFGNITVLNDDFLEGLEKLCRDSADPETGLSSIWILSEQIITCLRAEDVKQVLLNSNYRSPDIPRFSKHLRQIAGKHGLVVLNHDTWKSHRRVMSKAFHYEHLKSMVADMSFAANRFVESLSKLPEVDVYKAMKYVTMDIIGMGGFGTDFCCGSNIEGPLPEVPAAFEELLDQMGLRLNALNPLLQNYTLPTPINLRYKRCRAILQKKIEEVVEQRIALRERCKQGLETDEEHNDILKYMIPDDLSQGAFTKEEIRDELFVLLVAGFDTTSIFLTYCLHELAEHPEVEKKVQQEVDSLFEMKNGAPLTYEDVTRLKYCTMVMKEVLRLHPPAPLTNRTTTKEITLGGVKIPPNTNVWLPIFLIHRDKDNWGDAAEEFKPERFDEEWEEEPAKHHGHHQFAWIPFSGGQRNCIGNRFAMLEGVLVLAYLCRHLVFRHKEGRRGPLKSVNAGVIQKPKDGLQMVIHRRQ